MSLYYNCPEITIDELIDKLVNEISRIVEKGGDFRDYFSVMAWGTIGIGKSSIGISIVNELREKGIKCTTELINFSTTNPNDLRGIPVIKDGVVEFYPLSEYRVNSDPDEIVIYVVDEVNTSKIDAHTMIIMDFILNKKIGNISLPKNSYVIACGNKEEDGGVYYEMKAPLRNRLRHYVVKPDVFAFSKYAKEKGLSPLVVEYLLAHLQALSEEKSSNVSFCSPRVWEQVSNYLRLYDEDFDEAESAIGSLIGDETAHSFVDWCVSHAHMPSIAKIFAGTETIVPKRNSELTDVVDSMTFFAKEAKDDMRAICNSLEYGLKLPNDYAVTLLTNYMSFDKDFRAKLEKTTTFKKWLMIKGMI